jgi:ribonuclease HI
MKQTLNNCIAVIIFQRLRVEGDSQLVVRQVLGEYKVRSALLKPLHQEAMALKTVFKDFDIR